MKKFLLVVLMSMVLVLNICGFVKEFMVEDVKEVDHISETTITVYVE